HHFIHNKSILDDYSVGDYEKDSIDLITKLFKKRDYLILVGGSGLYADSILFGMDDIPKVPSKIKDQLNLKFNKKGLVYLQEKLKEIDLEYYNKVDLENPNRLIRAIGVYQVSGKKISSLWKNNKKDRFFNSLVITMKCDRDKLYERINKRVDKMVKDGLEKEVRGLIKFKNYNALNTVGYKEYFLYFDGKLSKEETINKIKQNTRNYAKRQITWFKKYNNALTFNIDDNIDELLNKLLKNE
ncbi:MAG: tRNA (adenosine(37)-N6)-dimethylallyltransferase MiaA, partial [Bacteroidota bacterium]|nr:tRNA (adenosine(37)-N6)-dimethylallyltransferase MiaA [Bacteroidota bacterium]